MPQHLKDLTEDSLGEPGLKLLQMITNFLNEVIYPGKVPNKICQTLFGANLTALSKEDGGVRPIAVGLVWRRLASKIIMSTLHETCEDLFNPNQLGVGTPKGAEAAIHAIRAYVENPKIEDQVILKIDFRNAFNCISRKVIMEKVREHTPQIYSYVYQCYSAETSLYFGSEDIIKSQEGVQQGDPLGPFLYCLGTIDLVKSCKSPLNLWYLDDSSLGGPVKTVLEDYKMIREASVNLGQEVNSSKCELYLINPHIKNRYERPFISTNHHNCSSKNR